MKKAKRGRAKEGIPYPFRKWRLKDAILFIVGWQVIYWLLFLFLGFVTLFNIVSEELLGRLTLFFEHSISIFLVACFLVLQRKGLPELGFTRKKSKGRFQWWRMAGAAAAAVAIIIVTSAITPLRKEVGRDYSGGGITPLPVVFVWIGLVGPVVEETEWRGIILAGIYHTWKRKWPAILVSSLIFSSWHLLGHSLNPLQLIGIVVRSSLGVILGYVYLQRRNIIAPILLHALTNGSVILWSRVWPYR